MRWGGKTRSTQHGVIQEASAKMDETCKGAIRGNACAREEEGSWRRQERKGRLGGGNPYCPAVQDSFGKAVWAPPKSAVRGGPRLPETGPPEYHCRTHACSWSVVRPRPQTREGFQSQSPAARAGPWSSPLPWLEVCGEPYCGCLMGQGQKKQRDWSGSHCSHQAGGDSLSGGSSGGRGKRPEWGRIVEAPMGLDDGHGVGGKEASRATAGLLL